MLFIFVIIDPCPKQNMIVGFLYEGNFILPVIGGKLLFILVAWKFSILLKDNGVYRNFGNLYGELMPWELQGHIIIWQQIGGKLSLITRKVKSFSIQWN